MLPAALIDALLLFVPKPRAERFGEIGRVRMDKDGGGDLTFLEATDGFSLLQLIVSAPYWSSLEGPHFIERAELENARKGLMIRMTRDAPFPDTSGLFAFEGGREMDIHLLWPQVTRLHSLAKLLGAGSETRLELLNTPNNTLQVTLHPEDPTAVEWISAVVLIAPAAR